MNRCHHKWLYLIVCLVLGVNLLIGLRVYSKEAGDKQGKSNAFEQVSVLMRVLHLIQEEYVDPGETDTEGLITDAIHGMVDGLDPFSSYLPPKQYKQLKENTTGEFGGIGIVVTMREGVITVVTPIEGTPGSEAGIQAGDKIVEIEGKDVRDTKLNKAVELMKGKPGTEVNITLVRKDREKPLELTIERAIIEVPTVKDMSVLENDIGYLRITQFNENTAGKLKKELNKLKSKGLEGIIIDVRNNPGGVLKSAVTCADYFLPPNKLIVSVKGRKDEPEETYHSSQPDKMSGIPVSILVNNGTASAAEILAGCLKDHNRAVLVGAKTFGKGSVQNIIRLSDKSALRLTTAKYHTPSDLQIHNNGIEPEIKMELTEEEKKELYKFQRKIAPEEGDEREEGEMFLDPQLKRALELLQNYGALHQGEKDAEEDKQEQNKKTAPEEGEEE